jgi:hypothetical protein
MSPENGTLVSNCTCTEGYDVGGGETRAIFEESDVCLGTVELIATVAEYSGLAKCWSKGVMSARPMNLTGINLSLPNASLLDYCDYNAGTRDDLWFRVQFAIDLAAELAWSNWFLLSQAKPDDEETDASFDFGSGTENSALLTSISVRTYGLPMRIEYFVSGIDAFRPSKLEIRFPNGVPRAQIRFANGTKRAEMRENMTFATKGELCWVDADGQNMEQAALGCPFVGQSASSSLFNLEIPASTKGFNSVGILSSPDGPDSVLALLAHAHASHQGTSAGNLDDLNDIGLL